MLLNLSWKDVHHLLICTEVTLLVKVEGNSRSRGANHFQILNNSVVLG